MKSKYKMVLLSLIIIIFTCCIVHKQVQNDTFFFLKTGEYILNQGIDKVEPFTFHNNLSFVKLRWGFDVLSYFIYKIGGFNFIYYFVLGFSSVISLSLFNILKKNKTHEILSFILTIIIIYSISSFFCMRAQLLSYLIFLFEIYILYKLNNSNNKKYSILLILLSILLVNVHSSVWLAYVVFFLPFLVENIFNKNKDKLFYITFIIILLTGFISPLGITPYTYIPMVMHSYSKEIINELKPLPIIKTLVLSTVLLIPILFSIIKRIKINISDFLYILGSLLMAILAIRNFCIALMIIPIPFTNILNNISNKYKINLVFDYMNKSKLFYVFLIITTSIISINSYIKIDKEEYIPRRVYPVGAINYIKNNMKQNNIRLFNDFNVGSYIEFNNIKAFIDSRSEVYCEEFNDTTILREWAKFNYKDKKQIYKIINKYNITHLLVSRNIYYKDYLYHNDDFKLLYEDEYFRLYKIKKELK